MTRSRDMSLDDLAEQRGTSAAARAGASRSRWLPEPEPRERVVHGDLGRRPRRRAARRVHRPVPEEVRRRGAARRRRPTTAARRGCGRARCCRTSASTRWSAGRRASTASSRRASTRCGAARGTCTRASPTWTSTACAASLCFPSFLPGFVGQRLTMWPDDDELALVGDARVQRLAPRGVVRRASRTASSRTRSRTCATRRSRPTRSAATRRAASRRSRSPRRPTSSGCRRSTPATGIRCSRRARRPDRAVPARRLVGHVADDLARRAARDPRGAVRRVRHVQRGRLAVLEDPGALPRHQICLSEGGIGWVAGIIDRLDHCYRYQLGYLPTWRDVDAHAERGAAPQLLVLRARRRRRACAMRHRIGVDHILVESDYPHADSSWPDTQAMLARQLRDQGVPDDEAAPHHLAERVRAVPAPAARRTAAVTVASVVAAQRARATRRRRVRRSGVRRDDDLARVRRAVVADGRRRCARRYARGDRVALQLPDGPGVHAAMLGCEKAGFVGGRHRRAGGRAGGRAPRRAHRRAHVAHRASRLPTARRRGRERPDRHATSCGSSTRRRAPPACPKIVMHDQARWFAFHDVRATASPRFTRRRRVPQRAARAVRLRAVDRALLARDRRRAVRRVRALRPPRRCSPRSSATASPCSPRSRRSS